MDDLTSPTWRKPAGILAILLLIAVWSVLIISASTVIGTWHWSVQAVFYLFAGIIWIAPLKPLLLWMETGRWRVARETQQRS